MNLAVKFNLLKNTQPPYSYTPESCLENDSYKLYFDIVCLNSKFPPPVELCCKNKNISKLGILITQVGNIIIL
jgi:hypothetical protein